jgi:hypothetical protein
VADNIQLNAGSGGSVVATDDIGGVHYPLSKLAFGALDSVTLVSAANPLPVTVLGTLTVNVGTTGGLALDATLTGGAQVSQAVGNVAAGAADSGAPVKIGGRLQTSLPAAGTNNNRVDAFWDDRGRLGVTIGSGGINTTVNTGAGADGANLGSAPSLQVAATLHIFNGSVYDRLRNNHEVTVLASAARTAAINSSDQTNYNARTLYLTWDITVAATGTLTLTIKYKDSLSGKYVTLLASAAQAGTGTVTLKVGPDLTAAANLIAKEALPRLWRAEVTGSDGSSWTYSVSANYML